MSWLANSLKLGLYCRSHLVENHWSWEWWGSDQNYNSQWKKRLGTSASKVTISNGVDPACEPGPPAQVSICSGLAESLPLTLWMIQRRHGRRSDETKRQRFGRCRCVWRKEDEENPKNKSLPTVETLETWGGSGNMLWRCFFARDRTAISKTDGGYVLPISACVYQVIIFPTVWRHQTQQYRAEGCLQSILDSHDP